MKREFSKEFKLNAISLVTDQGYSRVKAGKSLDIHPVLLGRWVREHMKDGSDAFRGKGKLTAEQAELWKLREENKRLKMEKENLKRAFSSARRLLSRFNCASSADCNVCFSWLVPTLFCLARHEYNNDSDKPTSRDA